MSQYLPKIIGKCINTTAFFSPKLAAKLAMHLFSTPRKGKLKPEATKYLETAIQDSVYFEGVAIQTYQWKGEKDTVLLAHGWESNTYRWRKLIEELKALDYNIIALDAPAHGGSGGTRFNAIMYAECIQLLASRFTVKTIIGHSVGGMAAVFFQYKYQLKSLAKLVLLGAPSNFIGVFNRYEVMMGYNKKVSSALRTCIVNKFNYMPEYFSPAEFSKKIDARGLIVHDKNDKIIPYRDGLEFKMNYRNSKFITTEGLGHGLKSASVHKYIFDFLKA